MEDGGLGFVPGGVFFPAHFLIDGEDAGEEQAEEDGGFALGQAALAHEQGDEAGFFDEVEFIGQVGGELGVFEQGGVVVVVGEALAGGQQGADAFEPGGVAFGGFEAFQQGGEVGVGVAGPRAGEADGFGDDFVEDGAEFFVVEVKSGPGDAGGLAEDGDVDFAVGPFEE